MIVTSDGRAMILPLELHPHDEIEWEGVRRRVRTFRQQGSKVRVTFEGDGAVMVPGRTLLHLTDRRLDWGPPT